MHTQVLGFNRFFFFCQYSSDARTGRGTCKLPYEQMGISPTGGCEYGDTFQTVENLIKLANYRKSQDVFRALLPGVERLKKLDINY